MPNITKIEVTGKNIEEARENAANQLGVSTDELQMEVIENAKSGFLGINSKPCIIHAWVEKSAESVARDFLSKTFSLMGIKAEVDIKVNTEDKILDITVSGDNMGLVIGRRGETLDALQYLTSIVVNKGCDDYTKVTLDTENYRQKRTEILERLADKVADKVVKNSRSMTLEPMNPFERRVIHARLQNNSKVVTVSIGEDPNRRVVVKLAK